MPPLAPQLNAVTGLAVAELGPLWVLPPTELEVALTEVLPATVDTYATASAAVAANWYDNERTRAGVGGRFEAIVAPLGDLGAYSLAGWATEPLRAAVPDVAAAQYRAEAGLQERLVNVGNKTVTDSAVADPRAGGWVRIVKPDGCDFCRMVAGTGKLFRESTARFACHAHCYCTARPAWGGEEVEVEEYRPSARVAALSDRQREDLRASARDWIRNNLGDSEPLPRPARPARVAPAATPITPRAAANQSNTAAAAARAQRQRIGQWLDAEDAQNASAAYWRRVDDENLHSIPPAIADDPAELDPIVLTPMDRAVADLEEAIDSGDDARVERAAAALEKLDRQEQQAAAKEARKAAAAVAEGERILELIEDGWDPAEAEAQVTGKTVDVIRRRDFIATARAEGHAGAGFDDLLSSVHQRMVDELSIEAENATRGKMVRTRYELQVSAKQLWSVNDATARKWMSEEMAAWFDENGRLTRSVLREMILSGNYARRATSQDYLQ